MAKILVADDNSNVQKTVALALADLGVEIESVNNGEAAVRKLAAFSPDLVLADIFMPVRNGYEVCEYVKKDSRFSHVPVVLLVGAFDPLDEREAKRVGADGILKKPFVPPEPLITMVKSLLDRMSEHLVSVTASKADAAAQARTGGIGTAIADEPLLSTQTSDQSSAQDFPLPEDRVAFTENEHPLAFGQLLETTAPEDAAPSAGPVESVDDDQVLTSSRDATLGDPVFWRNDDPATELEPAADQSEPTTESPSEDLSADHGNSGANQNEESLPQNDDPAPMQPVMLQPVEPFELVRERQEDTSDSIVETAPVMLDPASQAKLNVDNKTPEDLAANPLEWMATAPPQPAEEELQPSAGWGDPIPDAASSSAPVESPEHPQPLAPVPPPVSDQVSAPVSEPNQAVPPAVEPVLVKSDAPVVDKTTEPSETQPSPLPDISIQHVDDTVRSIPKKDWADLTASLQTSVSEAVSEEPAHAPDSSAAAPAEEIKSSASPAATPSTPTAPDPALVEAIVQRILEKVRPQVVDIITKEFLRPIVRALVHREIEKQ